MENDKLREKAESLLKRQQMLEELAEKHKLVQIRGGRLIWNASAPQEADQGGWRAGMGIEIIDMSN